ncbi:MAG: hypothetical protein KF780_09950 [Sphingomonas sp.]|nr:hypothetical protein [Sphingomonas sp.]
MFGMSIARARIGSPQVSGSKSAESGGTRFAFLASLVAVAGFAAPALAAQGGETRPPPSSSAQDIRSVHNYARCIARERTQRTRDVLAMDFRDGDYQRALRRLYDPEPRCQEQLGEQERNRGIRASFNQRLFAGRMAEALLVSDLDGSDLAGRVALDPSRPSIEARNDEELMSLCTVRAAPAETAAIFATAPASAEEAAAVRAITPHIAGCLPAGSTGEFNRPAIRSMLALAAYRLVQHNAAPAAAGN